MKTSTRLASLRNTTVLNDGRLRLWIVLVMAERVAFQQVSTRKRLRADLTLIRLFLGVHAHVTTQVIESCIALGTLATGVQTGSSTWPGAGGRLGFLLLLLLLPRLSIASGGRRVGGGGGLVLRARTLLRRFAVVLIDFGGGRGARASLHLHGLGSRRRRRRRRAAPAPGQMIARGTLPSQYCPEIAWAPPKLQPKRGQNARACAFAESQVEGISRLAPVAAIARWWSRARGRTAF
jgi:hypothetical protein